MSARGEKDPSGSIFCNPLTSTFTLRPDRFGAPRRLRPKTILCNQGDPIERLYLIESGTVKLWCENRRGRRLLVGFRSAGWLLGAAPAAAGQAWHITGEVLLPSRVRGLPLHAFQMGIDGDRDFRLAVLEMIGQDVVDRTRQSAWALDDVGERLARVLKDLAEIGERQADMVVLPALTQHEIAEAIPCGRETVARELARFEKTGLVTRMGRRLAVPMSSRFLRSPICDRNHSPV